MKKLLLLSVAVCAAVAVSFAAPSESRADHARSVCPSRGGFYGGYYSAPSYSRYYSPYRSSYPYFGTRSYSYGGYGARSGFSIGVFGSNFGLRIGRSYSPRVYHHHH